MDLMASPISMPKTFEVCNTTPLIHWSNRYLQNVNSYRDLASAPPSEQPNSSPESSSPPYSPPSPPDPFAGQSQQPSPTRFASPELSPGFKTIYKPRTGGLTFAHLLDALSATFPEMRFRFTSPHPKDFPDELIALLRDRPNVCKAIHLPAQSGSSRWGPCPSTFSEIFGTRMWSGQKGSFLQALLIAEDLPSESVLTRFVDPTLCGRPLLRSREGG